MILLILNQKIFKSKKGDKIMVRGIQQIGLENVKGMENINVYEPIKKKNFQLLSFYKYSFINNIVI